jgi:hypothetical protein
MAAALTFVPELRPLARPCTLRQAGIEFVRGTTFGWGRRDVANWLVCQYAPATVAGPRPHQSRGQCRMTSVDEGTLEQIVLEARVRVLRLFNELADRDRGAALARAMIAQGVVLPIRDPQGGTAYAAVALDRMRLAERAASLFVADYLNWPFDYRRARLCGSCGELALGAEGLRACCERPCIVELTHLPRSASA